MLLNRTPKKNGKCNGICNMVYIYCLNSYITPLSHWRCKCNKRWIKARPPLYDMLGGGCRFWLHNIHLLSWKCMNITIKCLHSNFTLYSHYKNILSLGYVWRASKQSSDPKNSTVPAPTPVLKFMNPPLLLSFKHKVVQCFKQFPDWTEINGRVKYPRRNNILFLCF